MKMLTLLTAAGLLIAGSAFASTSPTAATATSPAPATAAPAPVAAVAMHNHCRADANEKKLKGDERAAFIKKCIADSAAKK